MPEPCAAPLPVVPAVFIIGIPNTVRINWTEALAVGPLDHLNWFVRFNNQEHQVVAAASDGVIVTLTLAAQAPNLGVNEVAYSPPPFDVLAACGTPAAAFAGLGMV